MIGPVPELPDISAYLVALEDRIVGQRLERVRLASPFFLRTAEPPLALAEGRVEMRRAVARPSSPDSGLDMMNRHNEGDAP
jgi:formamidopyrimidine-DNA glycosylase